MQIKTQPDELENYLTDASNLAGGFAERLFVPETAADIAAILKQANEEKQPVTVSGARTGTVGGAIPFGGWIVSTEKLDHIKEIGADLATVECGVILTDLQRAAAAENLFYPPDPTEWSCQIGGTIATNASGARSFKYGATRKFVRRLEIALASGEMLDLRRGENIAAGGELKLTTRGGREIMVKLPTYQPPDVRKNASGYYTGADFDAIDLFIGSEGTLGIVTEIELRLLPKAESFLSGVVFFENENDLLKFAGEAKEFSFASRQVRNLKSEIRNPIDATLIEYFDRNSLDFIREKFAQVPESARGAIFFEQETDAENEDEIFEQWNELLEKHHADSDNSWFATNESDLEKMREFRHALPVAVNERVVRNKQKKVSTDMALPDRNFASFLKFLRQSLDQSGIEYVIFGHLGDNHLHANLLPKNDAEMIKAKHLYGRFVAQTIMLGGVISAEHGIGKLKRSYLEVMMGERFLNEMAEIKRALDPNGILGRGNVFDEKFL